jgi:hypothetical protein
MNNKAGPDFCQGIPCSLNMFSALENSPFFEKTPLFCINLDHYKFCDDFQKTIDSPKSPLFERSASQSRNHHAYVEHLGIAKVYLVFRKRLVYIEPTFLENIAPFSELSFFFETCDLINLLGTSMIFLEIPLVWKYPTFLEKKCV